MSMMASGMTRTENDGSRAADQRGLSRILCNATGGVRSFASYARSALIRVDPRLFFVLCASTFACFSAAALADGPQEEKARSLVATLRKADDEGARRDLFALGARSLAPLAEGLETEADPAAWTRLEETFEGVLRARLQELDIRLGRAERDQQARAEASLPAADPQGETATAVKALEDEVRAARYAAAKELAREGVGRDDFSVEARHRLFLGLLARLKGDAGDPGLAPRLGALGPLVAPLLTAVLESGPAELKPIAERARDLANARFAKLLADDRAAAREFAAASLFGMGPLATPVLEKIAREGGPDERHRAERLLQQVKWSISEELYRKTGRLLEGFEKLPWPDRRFLAYELEKQGGPDAVPTLRRILERDESIGVRVAAAEALARQGDRLGFRFLTTLGLAPLTQAPELIAGIAMDQGIRYLQIRRYEKAIEEFKRVLELQPENEIAFYNLACAYALRSARDGAPADKDRAYDALERSIKLGFEDPDHIGKDEDLASLRDDARFHAILEKLKLKKAGEKK